MPPPSVLAAPPPQSKKDAMQQKARMRHRGEAIEDKERDATPDLLLKYHVTLATYV